VLLFDSSSATPLWQYTQYGDYVASCALSADGSRAVAASWGQYGGTFGDVLTVFDRSSPVPIFQLLDDIDEPGSIFSVDVSSDGWLVSAGGKAVHAREFGNGGEVYAISTDVGIEANAQVIPAELLMLAPTPNPFTNNIKICFSTPTRGEISIKAYDATGRTVATVFEGDVEQGTHEVNWHATDDNGRRLSPGVYFLKPDYESGRATKKVILINE